MYLWRWTCEQQVAGSIPGHRALSQRPWINRSSTFVTEQYNLVPKRLWCWAAGEVTVGLAWHWSCVIDTLGISTYGLEDWGRRWGSTSAPRSCRVWLIYLPILLHTAGLVPIGLPFRDSRTGFSDYRTYALSLRFLSCVSMHSMQSAILFYIHTLLFVRPSVCLSVRRSVCLSVCPSVRLSVCLSVCPSVRLSCCGIVSKRMNISSNSFDHLVGASSCFWAPTPLQNSKAVKCTGWEKFSEFRLKSPFVSETVEDRIIVNVDH